MTNYELNQVNYANQPNLTPSEIDAKFEVIDSFLNETYAKYYMLMCRDIWYCTMFAPRDGFTKINFSDMAIEIIDILKNDFDNFKGLEVYEDKLELWITVDGEVRAFYLFPYTKGVIQL